MDLDLGPLAAGRPLGLACLAMGLLLAAGPHPTALAQAPGPPLRLEIEPNAIQDPATPMTIRVEGVPPGKVVHFQVLEDCRGSGQPGASASADCPALYQWDSAKSKDGTIAARLDFSNLRHRGRTIPAGRRLWLRASIDRSDQALYALFGLVNDPCDLWQSLLDSFHRGPCSPGLLQALLRHRSVARWADLHYEVRWLDLHVEPFRPLSVKGTADATGVAWLDQQTLLVTVAPRDAPSQLLRVPLAGTGVQSLWQPPAGDGRILAAPLALPGHRVAFVRQASGTLPTRLSVLDKNGVNPALDLDLPTRIHQLVAADSTGTAVLALTLGPEENHPEFLRIDLTSRRVESLGFSPGLYQAAFSLPGGAGAVVAFEDNSGQTGWDLVWVDAAGKLFKEVQTRPENDLLPALQTGGTGLAYLAEMPAAETKP